MVYCGKPSEACAECRAKRTRCDLARPSCGQCRRTKRTCSGYRDKTSVVFHDETSKVTLIQQHENHIRRVDHHIPSFAPLPHTQSGPVMLLNPALPIDEYARSFFFTNWVVPPCMEGRGQLDWLPGMWAMKSVQTHLDNAVAALSLASMSHYHKDPRLMLGARARYQIALRSINAALRDPVQSRDDQTLVTILLMGMYESYTCTTPRSLEAWTKHVNGGVAVLHLRGIEALQTPVGWSLFTQIRGQVIVNCIQAHQPVPEHMFKWSEITPSFLNAFELHNHKLAHLSMKFCNYWASIDSRTFADGERIIQEGLALQAELSDWAATLPPEFEYETIEVEGQERAFKGAYHRYKTVWAAHVWNGFRSIGIFILQFMLGARWTLEKEGRDVSEILGPGLDNEALQKHCKLGLSQLTRDVCRSVPYVMDWRLDKFSRSSCPKVTAANLLLWSLYSAVLMRVASFDSRETNMWIIKTFREIAEETGIKQARAMAWLASSKTEVQNWKEDQDTGIEEVDE